MIEIWKIKQEAFVNRGNIILKSYFQVQALVTGVTALRIYNRFITIYRLISFATS